MATAKKAPHEKGALWLLIREFAVAYPGRLIRSE